MPDQNDLPKIYPHYIPLEMRRSSAWVLWRLEDATRDGKLRKRCKVPKQATNLSRNAETDNPDTWSPFDFALAALPQLQPHPDYAGEWINRGIGLVVRDPFIGVDFDKVRDPETGFIEKWATDLLAKFPLTYVEITPSLTGLRVWFKGKLPKGVKAGSKCCSLEVYTAGSARFLTITGLTYNNVREVAALKDDQVRALFAEVETRRAAEKAKPSVNPGRFNELMTSIEFPDLSSAVMSLVTLLAYKHGDNPVKIEEEFKISALYLKTHWSEKWARLGAETVRKAIEFVKANPRKQKPTYTTRLKKRKFSEIVEEVLEWLWPKKIPRSNATLFVGDPDQGKSIMALDLAARGSVGADFLDEEKNVHGKFKTLLLMQEDHAETIIKPRLRVAGADMEMITTIDMTEILDEDGKVVKDRMVLLEEDLKLLRAEVEADPEIKLIVVDPLSNYMGSKNMFKDQEFRAVMMPVSKFAQDTGVSVIVVMHNSKQIGRTALQKIGGSLGGVGFARIGWTFVEKDGSREMSIMKKNLGKFPGITFTTESVSTEWKGKKTDQARVKFLKISQLDADTATTAAEDPKERVSSRAEQFFRKMVPKGEEVHSDKILEEGAKTGLTRAAVLRARSELGMATRKKKDGWYWSWPDGDSAPAEEKTQDDIPF